jgi:hypothetical protein
MTSSIERYRQVWRTWTHWPVFRVLIWLMMAGWVAGLLLAQMDNPSVAMRSDMAFAARLGYVLEALAYMVAIIPVLLIVAVPILIVWRTKQQMRDWRSMLTPHHRRAHLFVAAAVFALIFLVMACLPAALALFSDCLQQWGNLDAHFLGYHARREVLTYSGIYGANKVDTNLFNDQVFMLWYFWPAINALAWVLFALVFIAWMTAWASPWLVLAVAVFGGVLLACGAPKGESLVHYVDRDRSRVLCLLAIDALLFVGTWIRLACLSVGRESIQADERLPWLSGILAGAGAGPPGAMMQAGLWRRAGHRRRMGLGHRFIWTIAVFMGILIFASPVFDSDLGWFRSGGFAFSALIAAGIISALCVGLSWPQRFAELNEIELLRPAPRATCAREMGLAMLWDAAEISLALLLAMFLPIAYWSPDVFSTAMFWSAVAAVILAQALVFGAMAWTMLLRSTAASMVALTLAILALTLLLHYAMDDRWLTPSLLAGAMGVALTFHAYRRWLRADLI